MGLWKTEGKGVEENYEEKVGRRICSKHFIQYLCFLFAPLPRPPGDGWGGLVIVDGATVAMPLADALRSGLVDVPLIIQTMQGELDVFPVPEIQNWTAQQVSMSVEKGDLEKERSYV